MIIVTRPFPEGEELTQLLHQHNITAKYLPLFNICSGEDLPKLQHELNQLTNLDYVIIVSPHVSHSLKGCHPSLSFPCHINYFAIGKKSAELFKQLSGCKTSYPSHEDSEGLLELLSIASLKNRTVLILRGNSGRELLVTKLHKQQANVKLLQCYSRQPILYPDDVLATDIESQLIVITSIENLLQLEKICNDTHKQQARLLVTSPRILAQAKQHHWQHICLSQSANNQILFKTITTLCHNTVNKVKKIK